MVAANKIRHLALNLPGFWRIVWYGKLKSITKDTSHPYISAFLGQLNADPSSNKPLPSEIQGPLRQLWVPATNLLLLPLNTILLNGKQCQRPMESKLSQMKLRLDFTKTNLKAFRRVSQGEEFLPFSKHTLASDENYEGMLLGVGYNDDPQGVMIPCSEIFRIFYCLSSRVALAVLKGWFLDPERHIYNPAHTLISHDSKQVFLWLRRRMRDEDAQLIGRFVFSTYAIEQAQDIYSYAAAIKLPNEERLLRALPPFKGLTTVKGLGMKIRSPDGKERIVLTRILACDWRPPYSELTFDRDNDGRGPVIDDGTTKHPMVPWGKIPAVPKKDTEDTPDLTDEGYGDVLMPEHVEVKENPFPNENVKVEKAPQLHTEYEQEGAIHIQTKNWEKILSTVEGKTSEELVREALIRGMDELNNSENQEESPSSITQDSSSDKEEPAGRYLDLAYQLLKAHEEKIATVVFIDLWRDFGYAARDWYGIHLHKTPYEVRDFPYSHLYKDAEKFQRRFYWLAKIRYQNQTRYVFDIEERQGKQDMAILILWLLQEEDIPLRVLQRTIQQVIEYGRVRLDPNPYPGSLLFGIRRHTSKIYNPESPNREYQDILDTLFSTEPY